MLLPTVQDSKLQEEKRHDEVARTLTPLRRPAVSARRRLGSFRRSFIGEPPRRCTGERTRGSGATKVDCILLQQRGGGAIRQIQPAGSSARSWGEPRAQTSCLQVTFPWGWEQCRSPAVGQRPELRSRRLPVWAARCATARHPDAARAAPLSMNRGHLAAPYGRAGPGRTDHAPASGVMTGAHSDGAGPDPANIAGYNLDWKNQQAKEAALALRACSSLNIGLGSNGRHNKCKYAKICLNMHKGKYAIICKLKYAEICTKYAVPNMQEIYTNNMHM